MLSTVSMMLTVQHMARLDMSGGTGGGGGKGGREKWGEGRTGKRKIKTME